MDVFIPRGPLIVLVSVVIPFFNREKLLKRSILSVFRQTYPYWELLLVDDGSSDSSAKVVNACLQDWDSKSQGDRIPNQIQLLFQENSGVSAARNLGAKKARGRWIAFLDSDDEWLPEKLESQIAFHKANPQFLVSQTLEYWWKKGNLISVKEEFQKTDLDLWEKSLERCMLTPSSVIIDKDLFWEAGGFDERMKCCEDYDLWLRILSKSVPVGLLKKELLHRYQGHGDQLSFSYPAMERFRLYSLAKILREAQIAKQEPLPPVMLESAVVCFRKKWEVLSLGRKKRQKGIEPLLAWKPYLENFPKLGFPEKDWIWLLSDNPFL